MRVLILHPERPDARRFPVESARLFVGRDPSNDIVVVGPDVSRRHFSVAVEGDETILVDLGSKNGTLVNEERAARSVLQNRARIRVGNIEFLYLEEEVDGLLPFLQHAMAPRRSSLDRVMGPGPSGLNISSLDAVERDRLKLEVLLEAAEHLGRLGNVASMGQRIVDLLVRLLDIDRVVVLLADAETGELREARSFTRTVDRGSRHSHSIARYVAERRAGAVFADPRVDERLKENASIQDASIRSAMAAPLLGTEDLLGVVYVDNLSVTGRFTQEDLVFLCGFAGLAGLAIENARLYERMEREAAFRQELLRFFPDTVAQRLQAAGSSALAPAEVEATLLFCDLTDFVGLGARLGPRTTIEVLQVYLTAMSEVVFGLEGTLEKYIGDAVVAVWGAPYPAPDSADRAVRAAVAMQAAMAGVNARLAPLGLDLQVHIGLNTGRVVAGNVGSPRYLQYAAIGEATNTAARVCAAAGGGEILVTDATRRALTGAAPPFGEARVVTLKGMGETTTLWPVSWEAAAEPTLPRVE